MQFLHQTIVFLQHIKNYSYLTDNNTINKGITIMYTFNYFVINVAI